MMDVSTFATSDTKDSLVYTKYYWKTRMTECFTIKQATAEIHSVHTKDNKHPYLHGFFWMYQGFA